MNQPATCNVPIHRILVYKGVRHLGSISYRISLYCLGQTAALAPFVFYTTSPTTIGLFMISIGLNLVWLSLLFQFPKTVTGTCIAHAIVSSPFVLNPYGTTATTTSGTGSDTLASLFMARARGGGSSSIGTGKTATTATTTTGGSSTINHYLPLFNYQQALSQRCSFLLNRMHMFLQFHLIENFGCEFAANGLVRHTAEAKLRAFFQKRNIDGTYFNTYMLYYCGPTSPHTGAWTCVDGAELTIEQIVNCWKETHYALPPPPPLPQQTAGIETAETLLLQRAISGESGAPPSMGLV